jgi:YjbE family integral membrane protein
MGFDAFGQGFDVLLLDVLLGIDNAMVIALACRALPAPERRRAMLIGTLAAVALRMLLVGFAALLMSVPLFRLASGVALACIAIQLATGESLRGAALPGGVAPGDVATAVSTIVIADVVMSLDNAVGLIAVARDHTGLLVLGVLLNVPLLLYGSWRAAAWLRDYPALIRIGAAVLGWFAGDIAISDALYAQSVGAQSPALRVVVPALAAVFVLVEGRIVERNRIAIAPRSPRAEVARPASPRRRPQVRRRHAMVAACGLLVVAGGVLLALRSPGGGDLARYRCAGDTMSIDYRPGAGVIRVLSGDQRATGTLRPDRQIDWHDYHAVSMALGFAPPTALGDDGPQTVKLVGGSVGSAVCMRR